LFLFCFYLIINILISKNNPFSSGFSGALCSSRATMPPLLLVSGYNVFTLPSYWCYVPP